MGARSQRPQGLLFPLVSLVGLSLFLGACSREIDKPASFTLQLPRVIHSKGVGAMSTTSEEISMYIVSVSGNGFPPVIMNWEAHKMCPRTAAQVTCAVPPMTLSVPKGNNRMVQVLGLSGDGPGTPMTMYYFGAARNFAGNDEVVDVVLTQLQQDSGKAAMVKGRYLDSANGGPSGTVLMQFHPPVPGHPPMNLFRRDIVNGWFSFEFFSGFEVSYVMEKDGRPLFSRVRTGDDWMGTAAGVSGIFNPASRAANSRMSIAHIEFPAHEKFWTRNQSGVAALPEGSEVRSRLGSRVIVGFFGQPEFLAQKRVCHDAEITSDGVRGLYAAGTYSSPSLHLDEVATNPLKTGSALSSALDALELKWGGYQASASANKISVVQPDFEGTATAGAGRPCASTPNWNSEIRVNSATFMDAGNEMDNIVSFRGPFVVRNSYSQASHESPLVYLLGAGGQIQSVGMNLMPGVIGSGISGVSAFYRMVPEGTHNSHEFYDMNGIRCQEVAEGAFGFLRFGPDLLADAGILTDETISPPQPITISSQARFQLILCPFVDGIFGRRAHLSSGVSTEYYSHSGGGSGTVCPTTPTDAPARLRFVYNSDPMDVGSCLNIAAQLVDNQGCPALVPAGKVLELKFPTYATQFPTSEAILYNGQNCQAGSEYFDDTAGTNTQRQSYTLSAGQNQVPLSFRPFAVAAAEREYNITGSSMVTYDGNSSFNLEMNHAVYARPLAAQTPDRFDFIGPSITELRSNECRELRYVAVRNSPYTAVKVNTAYSLSLNLLSNSANHLELYTTPGCSGAPIGSQATIPFPVGSSLQRIYLKGAAPAVGPVPTISYALSPAGPAFPSTTSAIRVLGMPDHLALATALPNPLTPSIFPSGPSFCRQIQIRVRDALGNDLNTGSSYFGPDSLKVVASGAPGMKLFRSSSGCTANMAMYEVPLNTPVAYADGPGSISDLYIRSNSVGAGTIGFSLNNGPVVLSHAVQFHDVHQLKVQNIGIGGAPSTCSPLSIQYAFYQIDGTTLSTFVPSVSWSVSNIFGMHNGNSGQFRQDAGCVTAGEPVTGGAGMPSVSTMYVMRGSTAGNVTINYGSAVGSFNGSYLPVDLSGVWVY